MDKNKCFITLDELEKYIDYINFQLIDQMTNLTNEKTVCSDKRSSFDNYYLSLKNSWDDIMNDFIQHNSHNTFKNIFNSNNINTETFKKLGKIKKLDKLVLANESNIKTLLSGENLSLQNIHNVSLDNLELKNKIGLVNSKAISDKIENIIINKIANDIVKQDNNKFNTSLNVFDNITNILYVFGDSYCMTDINSLYTLLTKYYKLKYYSKLDNLSKKDMIEKIKLDIHFLKNLYDKITSESNLNDLRSVNNFKLATTITDQIKKNITNLFSFDITNELDRLIPDELGPMKSFFVKLISTYYNNLHPIVWTQIFKALKKNFFIDLPTNYDEFFSFASKHIILNSGPFILKLIQMIRPVLSAELIARYNLQKLTYPLLTHNQINHILSKTLNDWASYNILTNISASVGHVVILNKSSRPSKKFIVKIIKPISVAQTCWEYKILYPIFAENTCERQFVVNTLESIGKELNVKNEIANLKNGAKYYVDNYVDRFNVDIDACIDVVRNIEGIIDEECWYALTMTLAPGIPVSKFVEGDLLTTDSLFRARLHRCMDLLVYKFFFNLVNNGFYHGDLHAGNIFFSYAENVITLIDFGAVGTINFFDNSPESDTIVNMMIMSMFYNYDEMFDVLTNYLNTKCAGSEKIVKNDEYGRIKNILYKYKMKNIKNDTAQSNKEKKFSHYLFSDERISEENNRDNDYVNNFYRTKQNAAKYEISNSIYKVLEYEEQLPEIIIENRDNLAYSVKQTNDKSITFIDVIKIIYEFYAKNGVNVAIKFSEFNDFQKAYALLLGVLDSIGYESIRTNIFIKKAFYNWRNLSILKHIKSVTKFIKIYFSEKKKYKSLK
jgi:hypothetical protein